MATEGDRPVAGGDDRAAEREWCAGLLDRRARELDELPDRTWSHGLAAWHLRDLARLIRAGAAAGG